MRERERGIGMIAAEQSYSLQMGDHDSSKGGVHMLPLSDDDDDGERRDSEMD